MALYWGSIQFLEDMSSQFFDFIWYVGRFDVHKKDRKCFSQTIGD